jgi:hypothetical protein
VHRAALAGGRVLAGAGRRRHRTLNRPGFGRDSGGWFQAAVSASS